MSDDKVNVLCLKWGTRYPAYYVNRLYAGVKRNLKRPFRFVCVTNDSREGINPEVECVPFIPDPHVFDRKWPNIFSKLTLFKKGFAGLSGPTLCLDVDLLVTGGLDEFFDYRPGDFCIIHNWIECYKRVFRKIPNIGNSSCFRFEAGTDASDGVYRYFLREIQKPELKPQFSKGSQKLQTRAMFENGKVSWWPDEWVTSFKRQCIPAFPLNLILTPKFRKGSRIIAFHGHPNVPEAINGYRGKGIPAHLSSRPAPWVKELWELV